MSFIAESLNKYFEGKEPSKIVRDTLVAAALIYYSAKFANEAQRNGFRKTIMKYLMGVAKAVPLAAAQIDKEKKSALEKLEHSVLGKFEGANEPKFLKLPAEGVSQDKILTMMKKWKSQEETRWNKGQVSGGIYHGGDNLLRFLCQAYSYFALTNPLHPDVFPYIRKMESEVISMALGLFNGNEKCCGAMTTGGTESILVAMLAYRNRARAQGILEPEVVAPDTAHAAFDKAADYFGIKLKKMRVDPVTYKADMKEMRAAITKNTVALVGSAPQFPHGIIDPIKELSDLACEYKIGLHVDCCLGSFLIPMMEKLGYKIPAFDFRLPGVSSISADTHKYGFSPKGSSLVMFNSAELRQYMFFVAPEWPGGVYCSPTMTGSRAGGLVAATWAVMVNLGEEGYLECGRGIMKASKAIEAGIRRIEGLCVMGQPEMSVIAFTNDEKSAAGRKINIYMVSDAMKKREWNLNALQKPAAIHLCVTNMHRDLADKFLGDLRDSVKEVMDHPDMYKKGQAAIYGMAETISDAGITSDIAKGYLEVCLKAV